MTRIQHPPKELLLAYDHLCLDFTNTVFWRLRDDPIEGFKDYFILIKWAQQTGLLTIETENHLAKEAHKHLNKAEHVLNRAIDLRESLYRIIVAVLEDRQPKNEDLEFINLETSEMHKRTVLIYEDGKIVSGWKVEENELDQMLWPILQAATELLTSSTMERIGICRGEGCGWLFYDQSRNRSRKWCDMSDCGNRAKARRYYRRKQKNKQ